MCSRYVLHLLLFFYKKDDNVDKKLGIVKKNNSIINSIELLLFVFGTTTAKHFSLRICKVFLLMKDIIADTWHKYHEARKNMN